MIEYTIKLTKNQDKSLADDHVDVGLFLQETADLFANRKMVNLINGQSKKLRDDPEVDMMPATDDGILVSFFERPEYLSAQGRVEARAEEERLRAEEEARALSQKNADAPE